MSIPSQYAELAEAKEQYNIEKAEYQKKYPTKEVLNFEDWCNEQ